MEQVLPNEVRLKEIMKAAFLEAFDERRSLFYDLIAEVLEDMALGRAIKEEENSPSVSRAEVFEILEGGREG